MSFIVVTPMKLLLLMRKEWLAETDVQLLSLPPAVVVTD